MLSWVEKRTLRQNVKAVYGDRSRAGAEGACFFLVAFITKARAQRCRTGEDSRIMLSMLWGSASHHINAARQKALRALSTVVLPQRSQGGIIFPCLPLGRTEWAPGQNPPHNKNGSVSSGVLLQVESK